MPPEVEKIFLFFGITMLLVLPIVIYGFVMIDKLIKHIYKEHHESWIHIGKPRGMFYTPPNTDSLKSMMSMQLNIFVWTFKTPLWMKDDNVLLNYLRKFRLSIGIANIAMLGLFILIIVTISQTVK